MITANYLCDCSCGETVTVTSAGFSATTAYLSACTTRAAAGIASLEIRPSMVGYLEPANETPTYRHELGLVSFTGSL